MAAPACSAPQAPHLSGGPAHSARGSLPLQQDEAGFAAGVAPNRSPRSDRVAAGCGSLGRVLGAQVDLLSGRALRVTPSCREDDDRTVWCTQRLAVAGSASPGAEQLSIELIAHGVQTPLRVERIDRSAHSSCSPSSPKANHGSGGVWSRVRGGWRDAAGAGRRHPGPQLRHHDHHAHRGGPAKGALRALGNCAHLRLDLCRAGGTCTRGVLAARLTPLLAALLCHAEEAAHRVPLLLWQDQAPVRHLQRCAARCSCARHRCVGGWLRSSASRTCPLRVMRCRGARPALPPLGDSARQPAREPERVRHVRGHGRPGLPQLPGRGAGHAAGRRAAGVHTVAGRAGGRGATASAASCSGASERCARERPSGHWAKTVWRLSLPTAACCCTCGVLVMSSSHSFNHASLTGRPPSAEILARTIAWTPQRPEPGSPHRIHTHWKPHPLEARRLRGRLVLLCVGRRGRRRRHALAGAAHVARQPAQQRALRARRAAKAADGHAGRPLEVVPRAPVAPPVQAHLQPSRVREPRNDTVSPCGYRVSKAEVQSAAGGAAGVGG